MKMDNGIAVGVDQRPAAELVARLEAKNATLRAENEALKSNEGHFRAWRERVAAEFFQSERFGMNDIWIAIADLTRQRDEALQHYHAAIELEGLQKYATLLDERDALAGQNAAMREALENFRSHAGCFCNTGDGNPHTLECLDMQNTLAALNPTA